MRSQAARPLEPIDAPPAFRQRPRRSKAGHPSALLWAQPQLGHARLPGGLCGTQIVQTALRIIDAEGIEALSMRRIASDLGVGTMSLYWHVRNKEDLLWLIVDEMIGAVPLPPETGRWKDDLLALLRNLRAALLAHPRAAPLLNGRSAVGPRRLAYVDRMLGALRGAGLAASAAADAYGICTAFTSGFTMAEVMTTADVREGGPWAEALRRDLAVYLADQAPDALPNIRAVTPHVTEPIGDTSFALGVRTLIRGFEASLPTGGD